MEKEMKLSLNLWTLNNVEVDVSLHTLYSIYHLKKRNEFFHVDRCVLDLYRFFKCCYVFCILLKRKLCFSVHFPFAVCVDAACAIITIGNGFGHHAIWFRYSNNIRFSLTFTLHHNYTKTNSMEMDKIVFSVFLLFIFNFNAESTSMVWIANYVQITWLLPKLFHHFCGAHCEIRIDLNSVIIDAGSFSTSNVFIIFCLLLQK